MFIYSKGAGVSSSKLDKVIKKLRPSEKDVIIDNYHYLMDDTLPVDERIKSVICLMPMSVEFPTEIIIMQLVKGPTFPVAKDYEHTLAAYAKYILENCDKSDIEWVVTFMKSHKHCPDKYKTDFNMLVCTMQQAVDLFHLNTDVVDLESMFSWLQKYVKYYLGD